MNEQKQLSPSVRSAAAAIANNRGGRRGMPPIDNVLDLLPAKLFCEVVEEAEAALDAAMVREASVIVDAADRARLEQWIADLQSGLYVNCVYCGHRYGPGETTPVSMADALKAHVEKCPEHPMAKLRAAALELLAACEADFTSDQTEGRTSSEDRCDDDEAVAAGDQGESAVTFGMIRRLRAMVGPNP
jgi:hypothetical protein